MIRLELTGPDLPAAIATALPGRLNQVGLHLVRTIASKAFENLKQRLPNKPGWYQVYRQALGVFESGDQIAVAGYSAVQAPVVPGATSLVSFDNSTPIARVLSPYNPWTVDTIPVPADGYDLDVVIAAATESAVEAARQRLRPLLTIVTQALANEGVVIAPDGSMLKIKGKLYTDVVLLASLLEQTRPHWRPTAQTVNRAAPTWAKQQTNNVEALIKGEDVSSPHTIVSNTVIRSLADT